MRNGNLVLAPLLFALLAGRPASAREDLTVDSPLGPAPGRQEAPAAAWNGSHWLAVWHDEREPGLSMPASALFGTRVDTKGEPIDGAGIRIASLPPGQVRPIVVACGSRWLVVWDAGQKVVATRIGADGRVLDGEPLVISGSGSMPAATCAGENAVVVWSDASRSLVGARVDLARGKLLDPKGRALVATDAKGEFHNYPSVAWNGQTLLVTWHHHADLGRSQTVRAIRIGADLASGESVPWILSGDLRIAEYPRVAASGDSFLVVFSSAGDVHAARFRGADGGPVKERKLGSGHQPRVAGTATGFVVGWLDAKSEVEVFAVGDDLVPGASRRPALKPPEPARPPGSGAPSLQLSWTPFDLAASADQVLASWGQRPSYWMYPTGYAYGLDRGAGEVYAAVLPAKVGAGDATPRRLSTGLPRQTEPSMAASGDGWFVTWKEADAGPARVMGAFLGRKGFVPARGAMLSREGFPAQTHAPAIAAGSGVALVVWSGDEGTLAARLDESGNALDATPLVLGPRAGRPFAGFDGTRFVVAWGDGKLVRFRWVAPDGTLGKEASVDAGPFSQPWPRLACVRPGCAAVWRGHHGVSAALVGAEGQVSPRVTVAGGYCWNPGVRAVRGTYRITWQDQPDDGRDVPDDVVWLDVDPATLKASGRRPRALLDSKEDERLVAVEWFGDEATMLFLSDPRVQSQTAPLFLVHADGRPEKLRAATEGDVARSASGMAAVWVSRGRLHARILGR